MTKIKIKNKYFTVYVIVDKSVYKEYKLDQYRWYGDYRNNSIKIYANVLSKTRKTKPIYLHRLITNCPKGMVVDHINGDGLDNRLKNLRICTIQQNNLNIGKPIRKCTSKYLGVCYVSDRNLDKPWKATTSLNNKTMNLGYFKTELEAAQYRDKIVLQNRGEYARLNFKQEKQNV